MSSESDHPPLTNRILSALAALIRSLALLIVFALFPIAVIQTAFHLVDYLEIEKVKNQERTRHEHILSKIKAADDDSGMLSRSVKQVFDRLCELPSRDAQARLAKRLFRAYHPALDLYVFDRNGLLRPDLSIGQRPHRALEMCFATLLQINARIKVDPKNLGLVSSIIKVPADPELLRSTNSLNMLGSRERDGYFEWSKTQGPGSLRGYILLLHPGGFRTDRALRNAIHLVNGRSQSFRVGYIDPTGRKPVTYPAELSGFEGLARWIMTAAARYDQRFETPTKFATFIPRATTGYLIAYSPQPVFFSPALRVALHLGCLVWLCIILYYIFTAGAGLSFNIPAKLMGLFLFAIGTPSIVLLIGGYYALIDHENVLMQNLEAGIQDKLRLFDESLPLDVVRCERDLARITERVRACRTIQERDAAFRAVASMPAIDIAYIVDQAGNVVSAAKDLKDPAMQQQRKFTIMLARELINRVNKSFKLDAAALAVEATEGVIGNIVGSSKAFNLDKLSRDLGKFIVLSMGAESSFVFFDAIFNREGLAEYLVFIVMHRGWFQNAYLKSRIPSLMRQPDLSMTVSGIGEKTYLGTSIFHADSDLPDVRKMAKSVIQTRTPMRYISHDTHDGRLWYAAMGSNLNNFALVATTSLEPVKQRIRLFWMVLLLLALLVFVSALQIGRMLSEHFLEPIAALGNGMRAIQAREFQHQVPVLSQDEFGSLSGLMNHVLEGMKDLQVARIVQESLFPGEPLETGEYRIWGQSKAMADIGGDYFDYFMRPDGTLMGLVGDVSGHGVSAALIMGMAKCALTMEERVGRGLVETITSFNRFLLANIKKKKMMTMFLYALYPAENRLEFVNAGHNFPFWWHARTRTVSQIGSESFPLGVRAKAVYKCESVVLEPGDGILFFTDGLVEAPGGQACEFIGYDRAGAWFADVAELDPRQAVSELFERFDAYTQGLPAADDISLIILTRRPTSPEVLQPSGNAGRM
ncbi:MAG TPA: SpoIIE family protein phosphatase [Candidatus Ozemobacteraceae bacterium]|nr:SpoIIE family protein phosphatase [Candidatus Ozemobacteraceae bacterium]